MFRPRDPVSEQTIKTAANIGQFADLALDLGKNCRCASIVPSHEPSVRVLWVFEISSLKFV
jgi:hypothetical protein